MQAPVAVRVLLAQTLILSYLLPNQQPYFNTLSSILFFYTYLLISVSPFFEINFNVSELLENCSPSGTSPPLWESSLSASPRHRCV